MIAKELINHMIPPLKLTDTAAYAIAWLEEFRTKELPVVNNGKFLGLIRIIQTVNIFYTQSRTSLTRNLVILSRYYFN